MGGIKGGAVMKNNITSSLHMDKLLFDEIEFHRIGIKNENKLDLKMKIEVHQRNDEEAYKVTLTLIGDKADEYQLHIILSGYFSFQTDEFLDDDLKKKLINENTVAILMPYMRSQLSLLTAQPETECVVMPPLNIINILSDK
jgi:preprotein translocase subunit SecB